MKKAILFILIFFIALTLIISFTDILLTDYFFILSMFFLSISAIKFIRARLELRHFMLKKTDNERNDYRLLFRKNEKIAFYFFIIAILLFIISYQLA